MRTLIISASLFLLLLLTGCVGDEALTPGEWQSDEIMVEGVRTIRTTGGSVWDGPARLVEKVSIGSKDIEGPYLLGQVMGLAATSDRIYVLDTKNNVVKVFDYQGRHITDFGRVGAGPGEFRMPSGLAVSSEKEIVLLRDVSLGRVNVYSLDGDPVDSWRMSTYLGSFRSTAVTYDGEVYVPVITRTGSRRYGMGEVGPEGTELDTIWAPVFDSEQYQLRTTMMSMSVPFAPELVWTVAPTGALIAGISGDYRFTVSYPDGESLTIERMCEPVEVVRDERAWHRNMILRVLRSDEPGWSWQGPAIPNHKSYFSRVIADHDGRLWVQREGPGFEVQIPLEEREDRGGQDAYWASTRIVEVFELTGRFLGSVEIPDDAYLSPDPYIRGDVFIAVSRDEEGVPYIKRYQIEYP